MNIDHHRKSFPDPTAAETSVPVQGGGAVSVLDRYLGCLFGLAIGDALGAPVEFLSREEILATYGLDGIDDFYAWGRFTAGSYTDDTQMALATATGCLRAEHRRLDRGSSHPATVVYYRYIEWMKLQDDPFHSRFPGQTCLQALATGRIGNMEHRLNDSKGCGGVMRTAAAGLAFSPGRAFAEGAAFAAITHGHPSGYLSAGFLSELIARIISGSSLHAAIDAASDILQTYGRHRETSRAIRLSVDLAGRAITPDEAIPLLGDGWVGEEALAIALYCALSFPEEWKSGTLSAINITGDSDSTGAITGTILGAMLGIGAIPAKWMQDIEDRETIAQIGRDMYTVFVEGEPASFDRYPPN